MERFFGWVAPSWPWFKLNTDGACKPSGLASAGGLIRNRCGEYISGFGMNIGSTSITGAELWGLYQGLLPAWNLGIKQILVDVDKSCVTKLIENKICKPSPHYQIICSIKELIQRDWQVVINHAYRETNFAADFLANYALTFPIGVHVFNSAPRGLDFWLRYDSFGIALAPSFCLGSSFCGAWSMYKKEEEKEKVVSTGLPLLPMEPEASGNKMINV